MHCLRSLPLVLLSLLCYTLADVEFTSPAAPGAVVKAGDVITAYWKESGYGPRISQLTAYDLYLCAGGDTPGSYEEVATLVKEIAFSRGNSVSFQIDPKVGGYEPNAYFLKMVASGPKLSVTNLSQRFTITHMTGSFAHNVMEGIHSLPDYSGLDSRELGASGELEKRQAAGPGGVGGGAAAAGDIPADATGKYTIPYPLQTGATRYAPMAKLPGTTITAKSAIRQYPTSSYEIATTYLHRPTVDITVSASQKYSASSIENTASPAPQPDAKMKRFLERWRD